MGGILADVRAILYTRISQDRTGEGAGVARQETDCRTLAQVRGWEVTETAQDNDVSAAGKRTRPGFERVLASVESGSVQVVVAWALDRLTRNRRDTLRLIEACQQRGATIALVRGSDLDMSTPAGRLTADLLAAVARSEIEVKADRQARAAIQAAEAGRWSGGRRAFGFESDGTTVRENEARLVRDAYSALLDGVSLRAIAARWNAAGHLTPQATTPWTGAVVSRCLRKPRYAGLRSHRGEIVGEALWPALVDRETWSAAQAVMSNPDRRAVHGDQRLLTGVALCGVCGGPVNSGGGPTGRGVYRCANQGHVVRRRDPVDEYVSEVVVARLSRADAASLFSADRPDLHALLAEADQVRARLDGLAEAYADGTITSSQLRKGSERLRASLAEVEAKMTPGPSKAALTLAGAVDVGEAWAALDSDAQREIVRALMTVHLDPPGRGVRALDPETVRIVWA